MSTSQTTIDAIIEQIRERLIADFDSGDAVSYSGLGLFLQQKATEHLCAIADGLAGLTALLADLRSEISGLREQRTSDGSVRVQDPAAQDSGLQREILALRAAVEAQAQRLDAVVAAVVQSVADAKAEAVTEVAGARPPEPDMRTALASEKPSRPQRRPPSPRAARKARKSA
jgi:hypothetical protein